MKSMIEMMEQIHSGPAMIPWYLSVNISAILWATGAVAQSPVISLTMERGYITDSVFVGYYHKSGNKDKSSNVSHAHVPLMTP